MHFKIRTLVAAGAVAAALGCLPMASPANAEPLQQGKDAQSSSRTLLVFPANCTFTSALVVGISPLDTTLSLRDARTGETYTSMTADKDEQFRLVGPDQKSTGSTVTLAVVSTPLNGGPPANLEVFESKVPEVCEFGF